MKNDVVYLVTVTKSQDADGFETETSTEYEVMAEIKSIGRTEFYQAAHEGINVSLVAVINLDDFESVSTPSKLRYSGDLYRIVRTYKTSKLDVELTLAQVETDG